MFSFSSHGEFRRTEAWLQKLMRGDLFSNLDRFGAMGVQALARVTPRDSGATADSWEYRVIRSRTNPGIEWYNTNVHNGEVIAILIQYGHGTGTGGYVQGVDYINPAIRPVFDKIIDDIWRQVKSL